MEQNPKPVAESLYIVPMGDSKLENNMAYRMLLQAVTKEGKEQYLALESTIIVLIDMRLDGVLDHLSHELKWTRAQQARAQAAHDEFAKYAEKELRSLLLLPEEIPEVKLYTNLGMAVAFLWGIPECAVEVIRNELRTSRITVRPLMLPRPPPPECDIA